MKYQVSFARKHDINNLLSSHVKRSLLLWLYRKSRLVHKKKNIRVKWFGISLVFI